MVIPSDILTQALQPAAREWLDSLDASQDIAVLLPQLPRRTGRDPFGGTRHTSDDHDVDFAPWRSCDVAAAHLFEKLNPTGEQLRDLFAHGDFEERAMVMRTRAVFPADDTTCHLILEAQRTNTQDHMEALILDSDLVARAVDAGLPIDDFNRLILKTAFVDLPFGRMFGSERHASAELSTMVQDLATEREAAGRKVWYDTNRVIGLAPAPGTIARLLGGLEHGDDNHRLAAVEGIVSTGDTELRKYLEARLPREPKPSIRDAIESALQATT